MAASGSGDDTEASRKTAVLLALRYYGGELSRHRRVALPALLLPALGNICLLYLPPLIVAGLAGRLVGGADTGVATVLPYVLGFAALMLLGEVLWRVGVHCLNRTDGRGIEHLCVVGMNELLAKDAAFFHDNFAGSLTKRVLSFAARFNRRANSSSLKTGSTTGISSRGRNTPTTIVFIDVSIPRWLNLAEVYALLAGEPGGPGHPPT